MRCFFGKLKNIVFLFNCDFWCDFWFSGPHFSITFGTSYGDKRAWKVTFQIGNDRLPSTIFQLWNFPGVVSPSLTGGGFKHVLFSPLLGEMIQFDSYFSGGLKPPTRSCFHFFCLTYHMFSSNLNLVPLEDYPLFLWITEDAAVQQIDSFVPQNLVQLMWACGTAGANASPKPHNKNNTWPGRCIFFRFGGWVFIG